MAKNVLVKVMDSNNEQAQGTDAARFFYGENNSIQLEMIRPPELMRSPKNQQPGTIRINKHKTVSLNSDNTFYYGTWPQGMVSEEISEKLDKEAKQTIYYYKVKGDTYYEFELDDKRYIFARGYDRWFQVQFIKWIYNPDTKKAYTEKALWNKDESDDVSLKYFWSQAFQSTKKMQKIEARKISNLEKRLQKGMNNTANINMQQTR